jgi:hypothetical protein
MDDAALRDDDDDVHDDDGVRDDGDDADASRAVRVERRCRREGRVASLAIGSSSFFGRRSMCSTCFGRRR